MRFTRHRSKVRADVDEVEARVLADLAGQLLELVEEPRVSDDPLATLVGLTGEDPITPDDPILARLLPDAYPDDLDAGSDFRRYTDGDLRVQKRADAQAVLESLPKSGGRLELDRDGADRWLGFLNDARLALGTALGVTEELAPEESDEEDPAYQALQVYGWLGWLQESLLSCVEPRKA